MCWYAVIQILLHETKWHRFTDFYRLVSFSLSHEYYSAWEREEERERQRERNLEINTSKKERFRCKEKQVCQKTINPMWMDMHLWVLVSFPYHDLCCVISKEKKRYAMEKVETVAKENGIEIPPILNDLDEKTGMPKLFAIQEEKPVKSGEPPPPPVELQQLIQKQIVGLYSPFSSIPPLSLFIPLHSSPSLSLSLYSFLSLSIYLSFSFSKSPSLPPSLSSLSLTLSLLLSLFPLSLFFQSFNIIFSAKYDA